MRTELQRQNSRLNGAKSRGPRTQAGKQRSSQNACRHGLYSRRILSPEVRQALDLPVPSGPPPQFATRGEAAFHLAHLEYMHILALETRIFNEEIERQRILHPYDSGESLLGKAWRCFCETGVIEALFRLQSAVSRRVENARRLLETERAIVNLRTEQQFRGTNPTATGARGPAPAPAVSTPRSRTSPAPKQKFRETNPTAPANPRPGSPLASRTHGSTCQARAAKTGFRGTNPTLAESLRPPSASGPDAPTRASVLYKRGPPRLASSPASSPRFC